ncbi:MAG: Crp/Fnr family transcriptional regulator [Clostridia bacterium]|nr:Crp/Fnr family transcriptional regulator [Clostridia bacterium]
MSMLVFDRGEVIFKQGSIGKTMYDIGGGRVGIYADYGTDSEKLIAELGEGEVFGEMGLIEVYPRSATAVALEPQTVVREITTQEYGEYFNEKPEKILKILRMLSRRIRETDEKYREVCRVAYENEQADKKDEEKDQLNKQLDEICKEYGKFHTLWLN